VNTTVVGATVPQNVDEFGAEASIDLLLASAAPPLARGDWCTDDTEDGRSLPAVIMRVEDVGSLRTCTLSCWTQRGVGFQPAGRLANHTAARLRRICAMDCSTGRWLLWRWAQDACECGATPIPGTVWWVEWIAFGVGIYDPQAEWTAKTDLAVVVWGVVLRAMWVVGLMRQNQLLVVTTISQLKLVESNS
jgi:hypothetical protein